MQLNSIIQAGLGQLARRLIAVDLGSSHIKVLLVEQRFRQLRVLDHQIIDLQGEGLLSLEEINRHLQSIVQELGDHPLALAVPQHLSTSHLVDLPRVPSREIRGLVEKETVNLSGLSESAIVYDYRPLRPFGRHPYPFWVTISREQEIENQIRRFGSEEDEHCLCEVTTVANALIAAHLSCSRDLERRVLVDLGATNTVVAIIDQGQGVYAASFPIGGESFTNSVAALRKCSFEEAELLKRSEDLLKGPNELAGFSTVVDVWRQDLDRLLEEWQEDNPGLLSAGERIRVVLCGGGSCQPGLMAYLQQGSRLDFEPWPDTLVGGATLPMGRYAAAYGLALQSFRLIDWPTSLLPQPLRRTKQRQGLLMAANWAGFFLLVLASVILLIGTVWKWSLTSRKANLEESAQAALVQAQEIESSVARREQEYDRIRLLVNHQIRTVDYLKTLQILQRDRERRDLWFVLLADQDSYFAGATVSAADSNHTRLASSGSISNRPERIAGYVVEVTIPGKEEERLRGLHELVEDLKQETLFRNVDSVPVSQRNTNFFDPKVLAPDSYSALSLDLARRAEGLSLAAPEKKPPLPIPFPARMF